MLSSSMSACHVNNADGSEIKGTSRPPLLNALDYFGEQTNPHKSYQGYVKNPNICGGD